MAALLLLSPIPAGAQTTDPDDLGAIILSGVFTGFRKAPPPSYNGPLDAQALSDMAGGEVPPGLLTGVKAFARTWNNKDGDVVVVLLYRLPDVSMAGVTYDELARTHNESGARTATLRELPRAYSFIENVGRFGVVQHRGRFVCMIAIDTAPGNFMIADAIQLSREQASRFPAEPSMAAPSSDGGSETNTLPAKVISVAIFALLLWAFFRVRSRERRRERTLAHMPVGAGLPPVRSDWMRSTPRRARVAVLMLAVAGVVTLAMTVSSLAQASLGRRIESGGSVTFAEIKANDDRERTLAAIGLATGLATGIAWLMWQHRAHSNLERFGSRLELRFTPQWAVGWWFVPFANLVMPYKTMHELAELSVPPGDEHERRSLTLKIAIWWCLFAASGLVAWLATRSEANDVDAIIDKSYLNAVAGGARTVAAVLAIVIVLSIQRYQQIWIDSVAAPPAMTEVTPPPLPIPAAPGAANPGE